MKVLHEQVSYATAEGSFDRLQAFIARRRVWRSWDRREVYTFFAHLKWTWAVALGYVASIAVHFAWNAHTF